MRSILYITLLFVFSLTFLGCNSQPDITFRRGSYLKVFGEAVKQRKKVFVILTDKGCEKCEYFISSLNSRLENKAYLEENYICYVADFQDPSEKELIKLLKVSSFPFPYIFDAKGNLETFGFPDTDSLDSRNLSSLSIEPRVFQDLFGLTIPIEDYKKLVSKVLGSELALSAGNADKARILISESLDIAAYPYNLQRYLQLDSSKSFKSRKMSNFKYSFIPSDEVIYGTTLIDSLFALDVISYPDVK